MSGQFSELTHHLDVRVYYEDTDFSGVVYHANYLKYAERARSDFLRLAGVKHSELLALEKPLAFVVTKMDMDFLAPARIDDDLRVSSVCILAKGVRMGFHQTVSRGETCLWRAKVGAACVDLDGRPRRLPATTAEQLAPYVVEAVPDNFTW
jgi:acyl-CoA thioester hydrolase